MFYHREYQISDVYLVSCHALAADEPICSTSYLESRTVLMTVVMNKRRSECRLSRFMNSTSYLMLFPSLCGVYVGYRENIEKMSHLSPCLPGSFEFVGDSTDLALGFFTRTTGILFQITIGAVEWPRPTLCLL